MKAIDIPLQTKVKILHASTSGHIVRGHVIANKLRSSDENVVVEIEGNAGIDVLNVNTDIHVLSPMEEEYEVIDFKIKQALKLLNEAKDIATKDSTTLRELYYAGEIDGDDLIDFFDGRNGWNASTQDC